MCPDFRQLVEAIGLVVEDNILARAKRSKRFQGTVYQPGDFVRLKIYKPKPRRPKYTYKDGPLRLMSGTWNADTKKYRGPYEGEYEGVYMIHKVNKATDDNKIGRATTYTIVGQWSKETSPQWSPDNDDLNSNTAPSGIKLRKIKVKLPGHKFHDKTYPFGSFPRKFLKEELLRVETDSDGDAIVDGPVIIPGRVLDENEKVEPPHPATSGGLAKQSIKQVGKGVVLARALEVGDKVTVRFWSDERKGELVANTKEIQRKKYSNANMYWYKGEVNEVDGDITIKFSEDDESAAFNMTEQNEDDFLPWNTGWVKGHMKSAR